MVKGCGFEARRYVAVAAVTVGWHMGVGFTGGHVAIVTGHTVTDDTQVIEPGACKACGRMADGAVLGGWNMRGVGLGSFAGRRIAVVAGRTIVDDAGVIEHRRRKGAAGHMTGAAILAGYDVVGFGIFAGCIGAVVAGNAAVVQNDRAGVIDKRGGETYRVMAHGTVAAGILMNRAGGLPQRTERNMARTAIVARRTIIGDAGMVKY